MSSGPVSQTGPTGQCKSVITSSNVHLGLHICWGQQQQQQQKPAAATGWALSTVTHLCTCCLQGAWKESFYFLAVEAGYPALKYETYTLRLSYQNGQASLCWEDSNSPDKTRGCIFSMKTWKTWPGTSSGTWAEPCRIRSSCQYCSYCSQHGHLLLGNPGFHISCWSGYPTPSLKGLSLWPISPESDPCFKFVTSHLQSNWSFQTKASFSYLFWWKF